MEAPTKPPKKSSQGGLDRQKVQQAAKKKAKAGVLQDQLRIRKYINRIPNPIGPGAWLSDDVDVVELEQQVRVMVSREKYHPLPVFKVPAAQARPPCPRADSIRKELDLENNEKARKVQEKFDEMVKDGIFLALKRKNLSRKPKEKPATSTHSNARQQGTKRRREPTAAEQAIFGSQFEDDAIEWVIVSTTLW
jgi:hypothetical protein